MSESIYVSSSCVNNQRIADSVSALAEMGFSCIELSGGTQFYEGWEHELLRLQEKMGLSYRCHNYFPPPKTHFVLNLSSPDSSILTDSIDHLKKAIDLSVMFGAKEFGFHAGFRVDPAVSKLGSQFDREALFAEEQALQRFCENYLTIKDYADDKGVEVYVENNVYSAANAKAFGESPLLLTSEEDFKSLEKQIPMSLLLDVAHLKVSSQSHGLNFDQELTYLLPQSNYVHLSDNNGKADLNKGLEKDSELMQLMSRFDFTGKTLTLEVYDESALHTSYEVAQSLYE